MPFPAEKILILDEVDSTNNYAMAGVQAGRFSSGNAVVALQQTSGKGRRGKQWKSNKGENVLMSIIIDMQWLPVSRQFELSAACALAVFDFFQQLDLANLFIKWPNDIYVNAKKAAGILIENQLRGNNWQWAVIGIGANINQTHFGGLDTPATSVLNETGKRFDVISLAEKLRGCVIKRIDDLKSEKFLSQLTEYNSRLYAKDKQVKLKKENIVFETKIIGVSGEGRLLTNGGIERSFGFDEVSLKEVLQ